MARKVWGKRALLNLPGHESTAAIVAEMSHGTYGFDITLSISDCSRVVHLSFEGAFDDDDKFANDLHKVNTLIDCLQSFRRGLYHHRRKALRGS